MRMHSHFERTPSRYFWWATFALDADPLNRHPVGASQCAAGAGDCASWDLRAIHVHPGWIAETFMLFSLPVFVVVAVVVFGMGRLGLNEIWAFMIATPPLLFTWYYFIGLLLDRKRNK
jgi:hypothetical protein